MLWPNAKIALICPCGPPHLAKARQGMEILRSWGLQVLPGPVFQSYLDSRTETSQLSFLAAPDSLRWAEIEWALGGDCDACWVVRGGYGLTRLLATLVARGPLLKPRPLFGFSDVSALLHSLQARGWPDLVHGANVQTLPTLCGPALEATRQLVCEDRLQTMPGTTLQSGQAEGPLWGGNLCVLASLCGTPEAVRPGHKVLFLEDINEAPYRIDRFLMQLHSSGAFEGLAGVALGRFTGCGELGPVWEDWRQRWQVPVVMDLSFGHCDDNFPLPMGATVHLGQSQISWVSRSMRSGSGAGSRSSS